MPGRLEALESQIPGITAEVERMLELKIRELIPLLKAEFNRGRADRQPSGRPPGTPARTPSAVRPEAPNHCDRPRSAGSPASGESFTGFAGENGDQRNSASRGHVLAGGIVAGIECRPGNAGGERRESAMPGADTAGGSVPEPLHGALDALGFRGIAALVHKDVVSGFEQQPQQIPLEALRLALGIVPASPEADASQPGRGDNWHSRGRR